MLCLTNVRVAMANIVTMCGVGGVKYDYITCGDFASSAAVDEGPAWKRNMRSSLQLGSNKLSSRC